MISRVSRRSVIAAGATALVPVRTWAYAQTAATPIASLLPALARWRTATIDRVRQGGEVAKTQSAIATAAENWDEASPLFVAMGVLAWNLTPTDLATIADSLDDRFVVVRGDQYFDLMRATGDIATPVSSPQATPVS